MSTFADVRSFGCFVYFDGEVPARALLEELVTGFDLAVELKISTKNYFLRWKNLRWKTIDEAIANSETLSVALLVGTPQDVRLGGRVTLRADTTFPRFVSPPLTWLGAESGRWPEHVFTRVARNWLRISATQATPFSGGVFAASDLRNAKVEMTQEFHFYPGEDPDRSPNSFRGRMERERPVEETKARIRRVYPITLLGPQFASQVGVDKLVAAGAKNVEQINGSVIFDATPQLLEAWSPEYLAATVELRRLLWPMSFQNPADDPDARRKGRR
jgi:hypothetical protein